MYLPGFQFEPKNNMKKYRKLERKFFVRPAPEVAKSLLGKYIVRKNGNERVEGRIIETEAYVGPMDKAAHSYGGKITKRNKVAYLEGGRIYIYLVYGMYWQLNFTVAKAGEPECVLIRALDAGKSADGPGKVCRYLELDKSFYGEDIVISKKIWLEDRREKIEASKIIVTKRIGIDYAGSYWSKRKWRFIIRHVY